MPFPGELTGVIFGMRTSAEVKREVIRILNSTTIDWYEISQIDSMSPLLVQPITVEV